MPTAQTPFSYSTLAEIARSAWFRYYDRLGYAVSLPLRPLRQYQGRAYLNLSLIGENDANFAALEPLTFTVDGQSVPVATWSKPSLLTSLKMGRNQKKITALLESLSDEIQPVTRKAREWQVKTQTMRWGQAELLQVMEEIERVGVDSLMIFFAARHNLEIAYNHLLRTATEGIQFPDNLALVNNALSDLDGLVEVEIAQELMALAHMAEEESAVTQWLKTQRYEAWQDALGEGPFAQAMQDFLDRHGHRCAGEGEMRNLRWYEDPTSLFQSIHACILHQPKAPATVPSTQSAQKLLDAVGAKRRREAEGYINLARRTLLLQSQALHAFSHILAGTREWALAAAREAMSDQRIRQEDDVFFYELEETKQMMTSEWNVSDLDGIRETAQRRRQTHAQWQTVRPHELLVGDVEAHAVRNGLTGVIGLATGPLRRQETPRPPSCKNAIVGAVRLDTGWATTLPMAAGYVTARGTPIDPIVAAARIWHIPTVLGLHQSYDQLIDGAQTQVDGVHATVEQ